jgi:hypothetical protein
LSLLCFCRDFLPSRWQPSSYQKASRRGDSLLCTDPPRSLPFYGSRFCRFIHLFAILQFSQVPWGARRKRWITVGEQDFQAGALWAMGRPKGRGVLGRIKGPEELLGKLDDIRN